MSIDIDLPVIQDGAMLGERPDGWDDQADRQQNPSPRHQALIELMKMFPETALRLVAPDLQLGYDVSGPLEARTGPTDAGGLRSDLRLEYYRSKGSRVLIAIIVEVQLNREADLRWRMCPYVGFVSHECRCATDILVLCQTRTLAAKLGRPMLLGARGSSIVPRAVGPDGVPVVTSEADAVADPGLLVLSAWYHTRRSGKRREVLVQLLVQVYQLLKEIDPEKAKRYDELALAILPELSARRYKELSVGTITEYVGKKYYPEIWNPAREEGREEGRELGRQEGRQEGREEGRAEGQAVGWAGAILALLKERKIRIPATIREQIVSCQDVKLLEMWFRRSATAGSAREVVAA